MDNIPLIQSLLEAQQSSFELDAENRDLKAEIARLTEVLSLKGRVEFKAGSYRLTEGDGEERGPFCTGCWDSHRKLIRFSRLMRTAYVCPVCNAQS